MYLTVAAFIARFASSVIFYLLNDSDQNEPQWANETFPTTVTLNSLIVAAELEINSYLGAYDLSLFENEVPSILIELTSNITLYNCHKYKAFEDVPEEVKVLYGKSLSILQGIAAGSFVLLSSQVRPSKRLITSFSAVNFMAF
jgi:phage gp36-like protein